MDEREFENTNDNPAEEDVQSQNDQENTTESPDFLLALLIYDRTAANKTAAKKWLMKNCPPQVSAEEMEVLLEGIDAQKPLEHLKNVDVVNGSKDRYYYDGTIMTREFAKIDALIEDKDILSTIASVTRSDCKLYPRPTEFSKLTGYPFRFTPDEVEGAAARMTINKDYSDIGVVEASNGEKAFYSDRYMKKVYALSLLEYSEVESKLSP